MEEFIKSEEERIRLEIEKKFMEEEVKRKQEEELRREQTMAQARKLWEQEVGNNFFSPFPSSPHLIFPSPPPQRRKKEQEEAKKQQEEAISWLKEHSQWHQFFLEAGITEADLVFFLFLFLFFHFFCFFFFFLLLFSCFFVFCLLVSEITLNFLFFFNRRIQRRLEH